MSEAVVAELLAKADPEQAKMMEERVILLDFDDNVIGHESKTLSHVNDNINRGMLHRAFSVFLFTPDGRLVIQQRALTKVTFPGYFANTCCSHPLYVPEELEAQDQMGVKRAARRKLEQELGIPPEDVPIKDFTYLTRVHYVASSDGVFGEHEIDYILFLKPKTMPRIALNPNEIASTRTFTQAQMKDWMATAAERGDSICPWFKFIHDNLLHAWWSALLNGTLATCYDPVTIHRAPGVVRPPAPVYSISAPPTAAAATPVVAKQGAYGKVRIHKHSLLSQLFHVSEVWAVTKAALNLLPGVAVPPLPAATPSLAWCETKLVQVSRSFAMVIQQLPLSLRTCVGNFYLVLRGLDTVEDDMEHFTDPTVKVSHLHAFHTYLSQPGWQMDGIGEGAERELLTEFGHVIDVFQGLPKDQQVVIADVTARMGQGMALFASRNLKQGTNDIDDYGMYCHFVAGLVGEGLSRLFAATGFETADVANQTQLANDMGLFLQKTNIIRDYLEDFVEGRAFWPKEIWGQYASDLGEFANNPTEKALSCLNHMVADALTHVPACLRYLSKLNDASVFRFCAIPQLMAIATLDEVANNPLTFTGVVKIRKGLAVKLISQATNMASVCEVFLARSRSIARKVSASLPAASLLAAPLSRTEAICVAALPFRSLHGLFSVRAMAAVAVALFGCLAYLNRRYKTWHGRSLPPLANFSDFLVVGVAFLLSAYLVAFCGVPIVASVSGKGGKDGLATAFAEADVLDEAQLLKSRSASYVSWADKEAAVAKPAASGGSSNLRRRR